MLSVSPDRVFRDWRLSIVWLLRELKAGEQSLLACNDEADPLGNTSAMRTWGFSVSPDGRWLLYAQFEPRGSDLMVVENFH